MEKILSLKLKRNCFTIRILWENKKNFVSVWKMLNREYFRGLRYGNKRGKTPFYMYRKNTLYVVKERRYRTFVVA